MNNLFFCKLKAKSYVSHPSIFLHQIQLSHFEAHFSSHSTRSHVLWQRRRRLIKMCWTMWARQNGTNSAAGVKLCSEDDRQEASRGVSRVHRAEWALAMGRGGGATEQGRGAWTWAWLKGTGRKWGRDRNIQGSGLFPFFNFSSEIKVHIQEQHIYRTQSIRFLKEKVITFECTL